MLAPGDQFVRQFGGREIEPARREGTPARPLIWCSTRTASLNCPFSARPVFGLEGHDVNSPNCMSLKPGLSGGRSPGAHRGEHKSLVEHKIRVAVVGSGGAAAHVYQQLTYLSAGTIVPIDADRVDITSLSRLIGALPPRPRRTILDRLLGRGKGDIGRLKVDVMTRMINAIDLEVHVIPFAEFFPTQATVDTLRHCDLIVACVDRLQVRDDLNRFAKRYLTPLIDVGIEITRDLPARLHLPRGHRRRATPARRRLRPGRRTDPDHRPRVAAAAARAGHPATPQGPTPRTCGMSDGFRGYARRRRAAHLGKFMASASRPLYGPDWQRDGFMMRST